MGSVCDSFDNALAESNIGLYKTEVVHRSGPWRSFDAIVYATLDWVQWFDNQMFFTPIGDIPPADFEEMYHQQQQALAMTAGVN